MISTAPAGSARLLLPQLLRLLQDGRALHPQQQKHRHYRQQGRARVRDDELKHKQGLNIKGGGDCPKTKYAGRKNLDSLTELSLRRRNILITDRQRVVVGDEEDMEDGCGGQVAGQQAGGVG